MPNYEEILKQSEQNVFTLKEKLVALDELHKDLKKRIRSSEKIPLAYNALFEKIKNTSEDYIHALGGSVDKFLDGNNLLFTENLKELSHKNEELKEQVTRLVQTDFEKQFQVLQNEFIAQTRKDLETEFDKFDLKLTAFHTLIDNFKIQVDRLENTDLENQFKKLDKTLSEVSQSINGINQAVTSITRKLNSVVQSIDSVKNVIWQNHEDLIKKISAQDLLLQNIRRENTEKFDAINNQLLILNKGVFIVSIILGLGLLVVFGLLLFQVFGQT